MGEAHVRTLVVNYLAGRISLQDLDLGISPMSWDFGVADALRALVNDIELRLDEYSSGQCNETELRRALVPFVTDYETALNLGPIPSVHVHTGLSSVITARMFTATPIAAGTRLVEEFS